MSIASETFRRYFSTKYLSERRARNYIIWTLNICSHDKSEPCVRCSVVSSRLPIKAFMGIERGACASTACALRALRTRCPPLLP